MTVLLEVREMQAWYAETQVLFGVDLSVENGQVVALMGRNGMGKSTTLGAVCGLVQRRKGQILFAGKSLPELPVHEIARTGIGLVPEGRRVFANLSVRENMTAAARPGPWDLARVFELFPRIRERLNQSASTLSGGEQQMLVIARALMTNPRLLIMDEATEGLAPIIRQEIWTAIRELKQQGMSILLVDKSLQELLSVADHCFILEKGLSVWSGASADLHPELAQRYLGV